LILIAQYFAFTLYPDQGFSLMKRTFQNWSFDDFAAQMKAVMPTLEWIIVGLGCLLVLGVDLLCERKIDVGGKLSKTNVLVRWPVLFFLILAIAVFGIYGAGYDSTAFLYTQF